MKSTDLTPMANHENFDCIRSDISDDLRTNIMSETLRLFIETRMADLQATPHEELVALEALVACPKQRDEIQAEMTRRATLELLMIEIAGLCREAGTHLFKGIDIRTSGGLIDISIH